MPFLVPTLNLALRSQKWEEGALLKELLGGKNVQDLWEEYKVFVEASENGAVAAPPVPTHV